MEVPGTTTVVSGLSALLINKANAGIIKASAKYYSEKEFHAYQLLTVFAHKVVENNGPNRLRGEVFSQPNIYRAFAIVRSSVPARIDGRDQYPQELLDAERDYFSDELEHVRDWITPPQEIDEGRRRPRIIPGVRVTLPALCSTVIEAEKARAMASTFSNFLKYSTPSHQAFYLRGKYAGLTKANAKQLVKNLGISTEERLEMAKKAYRKYWEAKPFVVQRELWAAERVQPRDEAVIVEIRVRYQARCLEVVQAIQAMEMDPEIALPYLISENKLDEKKHYLSQFNEMLPRPFISLSRILQIELPLIAETNAQDEILRYRYRMLLSLDENPDPQVKRNDLTPLTGFGLKYIQVDKGDLAHLAPRIPNPAPNHGAGYRAQVLEPSGPDVEFSDLAPKVFHASKLRSFLRRDLMLGRSVLVNGISAHLRIVTPAQHAQAEAGFAQAAAVRRGAEPREYVPMQVRGEGVQVQGRLDALARKEAKERAKYVYPADAELVFGDPGIRNIFGLVRAVRHNGYMVPGKPWVISGGSYYWETGIRDRVNFANRTKQEEDRENDAFKAASTAVTEARTKTAHYANCLAALKTRGAAYRTMFKFYGQDKLARIPFSNYQETQKFLAKTHKDICPTKKHILILGDGTFADSVKGLPPAVVKKITRYLISHGVDVRFVDEFRSSLLHCMYPYPVMMGLLKWIVKKKMKNGKVRRSLYRVHGLLQASVPGNPSLVNRDKNAPQNIMSTFVERSAMEGRGEVTPEFTHAVKNEDLYRPPACFYRYYTKRNGRRGYECVRPPFPPHVEPPPPPPPPLGPPPPRPPPFRRPPPGQPPPPFGPLPPPPPPPPFGPPHAVLGPQ